MLTVVLNRAGWQAIISKQKITKNVKYFNGDEFQRLAVSAEMERRVCGMNTIRTSHWTCELHAEDDQSVGPIGPVEGCNGHPIRLEGLNNLTG